MGNNEKYKPANLEALTALIDSVKASGGSEIANFQPFIERFTEAMGLPKPDFAGEEQIGNDYCFERGVEHRFDDGRTSRHRIDLYKRDCFIMEAKQSAKRLKSDPFQQELYGTEALAQKPGHAKRGTRTWDKVMSAARNQGIGYARDLPVEHGYPPFILVIDIGHVIDIYADFSGQGKNYAQFPDRNSYRLSMDDLLEPDVQDRLARIFTDPQSLDPAREASRVTKDIAERLAKIAAKLEKQHAPGVVAEFLMRCLFTMFAEDVALIPDHKFEALLESKIMKPDTFAPALEAFWKSMDQGGYDAFTDAILKRFNGALFKDAKALPLDSDQIRELHVAAKRDWKDVEPAIFGTLLEQALDPRERGQLGAHFTPRAYVERLVIPTIIEPLRNDWEDAQAHAAELEDEGKHDEALKALRDFHHQLCTTRVLDPACGTGNFLYVSLELIKRLEGEVLEALESFEDGQASLAMDGETVTPRQFYGLEINPRAVPIADLVLWIGYLKWQLKNGGLESITEPVLHAYGTIKVQDAILAYDRRTERLDENGKPVTIWDGFTKKAHPVTGLPVPDDAARVQSYTYNNPRRADWPSAEFIVGNPPFIGAKYIRQELGDGYAEACWKARPDMPGGADFVMHFWDEAARRLTAKPAKGQKNPLRRFGFITTNSITQTFSRRVIETYQSAKQPLSLIFAIPDHPWLKAADKAAVRIAMTVAAKGSRDGALSKVVKEDGLNTDTPNVQLESSIGKITANLRLGADTSAAKPLLANEVISSPGVKLHGSGFIVTPKQAASLGLGKIDGLEKYILDYRNGRDLAATPRGVKVIDLYGLKPDDIRNRFPDVYQHIVETVKPHRDENNRETYRDNWWIFGEPRSDMRDFLRDLSCYIATPVTSKHRFFQFLDKTIIPDDALIGIGISNFAGVSVLSSRPHVLWALAKGATLEDRPRYIKSAVFDPFPFPALLTDKSIDTTLPQQLGEDLDVFRKARLENWSALTMTKLYNALERYREAMNGGAPLTDAERDVHEKAQVAILAELHDDIDRAVLDAYGWADLAPALIGKPGGTTPSTLKSPEQEEAEEELLIRLVALNKERAAEEARGQVRWLRPDYQIPKLGHKVAKPKDQKQIEADIAIDTGPDKPSWPKDGLDQIRIVRDVLGNARAPIDAEAVARAFKERFTPKRRARVAEVLANLTELGLAQKQDDRYSATR